MKPHVFSGLLILILLGASPDSFAAERIRGTVDAYSNGVLQVKSRAGNEVMLKIASDAKINSLRPLKMRDIRVGSFVGVTAKSHGPGTPLQALEVHLFPESMRGTGEGHYDWDLEPGSSMTNANVDAVVNTNDGKVLSLGYRGGKQKILVPAGVPLVAIVPGDVKLLVKGAQVFVIAEPEPGGSLKAERIQVGAKGAAPPM